MGKAESLRPVYIISLFLSIGITLSSLIALSDSQFYKRETANWLVQCRAQDWIARPVALLTVLRHSTWKASIKADLS